MIEPSVNSVRISVCIKQADELEENVDMTVEMRTELMHKNAKYHANKEDWHDVMAESGHEEKTPEEEMVAVLQTIGDEPVGKPLGSPLVNLEKETAKNEGESEDQTEASENSDGEEFKETRSERKRRLRREAKALAAEKADQEKLESVEAEKKRHAEEAVVLATAAAGVLHGLFEGLIQRLGQEGGTGFVVAVRHVLCGRYRRAPLQVKRRG